MADSPRIRKALATRAHYDFSAFSVREELRRTVNPTDVAKVLTGIMNDPSASDRDRIMAAKTIMDRRDGMPVAMVLTAHASADRALAQLPATALAQIEGVLRAQLAATIESDDSEDDE
jgi:hypothetical protein